jgi:hypothetical protein
MNIKNINSIKNVSNDLFETKEECIVLPDGNTMYVMEKVIQNENVNEVIFIYRCILKGYFNIHYSKITDEDVLKVLECWEKEVN